MDDDCLDCKAGGHPFVCFVCEHEGCLEYYRASASLDQIAALLIAIKLCGKHAAEVEAIRVETERLKCEIERGVA